MIVFIRTLPLTLALAALLALPHFVSNSTGSISDTVNRLQAFAAGDLEALDGFELPDSLAPSLESTNWSSDRYADKWTPVLDSSVGLKQGDVGLASILRATELPIDAHLKRSGRR